MFAFQITSFTLYITNCIPDIKVKKIIIISKLHKRENKNEMHINQSFYFRFCDVATLAIIHKKI
jgi:hypothetical protein